VPANPDTSLPPSTNIDIDGISAWPHPVFALSHRFLAYAYRICHAIAPGQQQTQTPVCAEGDGAQPDLGAMAMHVGGNVLSRMQSLGGRTLTAVHAHISDTLSMVPSKPLSCSSSELVVFLARPQAVSWAKLGQNRLGPAGPQGRPALAFGLAGDLKSQSPAVKTVAYD